MDSPPKYTFIGTLPVERVPGEFGRYHVGDKRYLTDVYENFGLGWCGCKDFEFNRSKYLPKELAGIPDNPDRYRCKHLKAARIAEGLDLVEQVIRLYEQRRREKETGPGPGC